MNKTLDKTKTLNMLKAVFEGRYGKQLDDFLKAICGYEQDLFSEDMGRMAYLVGRRSVYITIKRMLEEAKDVRNK